MHYPKKRVEMMGFALMGSTAGSLLGPVIGGSLYEAGGYTLPFAVTGVLVAVDAGLCVFLLPSDRGGRAASPGIRAVLVDKSVLVAAAAVALAAIGWGIIEPLLPVQLEPLGGDPRGDRPDLHRRVDRLRPQRAGRRMGFKPNADPRADRPAAPLAMAAALSLLSLNEGAIAVAVSLCLVSVSYAFMLNPTSAELGNAVDRRKMSCYGAVYAITTLPTRWVR